MTDNKIRVTIDQLGKPVLEGVGFSGTACDAAMAPIEAALGGAQSRENKPEYNEIDTGTQAVNYMTLDG